MLCKPSARSHGGRRAEASLCSFSSPTLAPGFPYSLPYRLRLTVLCLIAGPRPAAPARLMRRLRRRTLYSLGCRVLRSLDCARDDGRAAWYPAPGCRNYNTGVLVSIGNSGRSWSSTVYNTNVYYLVFDRPRIYPNQLGPRTYGFQVRCLRE